MPASSSILVDIYQKQIMSILEYVSPVWGPMITHDNSEEIERVQKCAVSMILEISHMKRSLLILRVSP